jgi:hypothetical protein
MGENPPDERPGSSMVATTCIPRAFRGVLGGTVVASSILHVPNPRGGLRNEEIRSHARRRVARGDPRAAWSRQRRTAVPRRMRGPEEGLRADGAGGEADLQAGLPNDRRPDRAGCMCEGVLGHVPLGQDQLSGRSRQLPRHVQSPVASRTATAAEQLPRHLRHGPGNVRSGRRDAIEELRHGVPERLGSPRVPPGLWSSSQARRGHLRV